MKNKPKHGYIRTEEADGILKSIMDSFDPSCVFEYKFNIKDFNEMLNSFNKQGYERKTN